MVKNIKSYECSECGEIYKNKEEAEECCKGSYIGSALFIGILIGAIITMFIAFAIVWNDHLVDEKVLEGICKEKYGTNYTFQKMENRNIIGCQKAEQIDGQEAYIKIIGET